MQNKLQELTEKLYTEGLSKGKLEAEEMKKNAEIEALDIIAKANESYNSIMAKAKKEAEDLKINTQNELKIASRQVLSSLKQQIETMLTIQSIQKPINEVFNDNDLLIRLLTSAIASFNPSSNDAVDLNVILPDQMKKELDSFLKINITNQLSSTVDIKFDSKISNGFKIGPKDQGYYISFTDKDFQDFLSEYLRPKTREILFSEK